ncbi:MAG: peptide-methionine (S)-S-oxide reductase MsrA [Planctomycetia bacterium]|nr:MAG: peptide-methionine (S)-S-oxide reductase MsrA [Planctomycetia bacterium]
MPTLAVSIRGVSSRPFSLAAILLLTSFFVSCTQAPSVKGPPVPPSQRDRRAEKVAGTAAADLPRATFGAGCFWCAEAVFQDLAGVESVVSGYSGGAVESPTYELVSGGATGHAEVVQITYNPDVIAYAELLEVFWKIHDPTTPNRQGNDVGSQYRSVVFYHDDDQQAVAERKKRELDEAGAFDGPIVTQIEPFREFYSAERYHQNYYRNHPDQPYCALVIRPKMEKFRQAFGDKRKKEAD